MPTSFYVAMGILLISLIVQVIYAIWEEYYGEK